MTLVLDPTAQMVFDALTKQYPLIELVEFYDTGGTARVFHVRLPVGPSLDFKVDRVVKVLRHDGDVVSGPDIGLTFKNEIKHLVSSSHPNVIALYSAALLEVTETITAPYFIMEYITGAQDLDKWLIANAATLTGDRVIYLLTQVANGLAALHHGGVFHCDIKAGNLFVGADGQVKIADFGFSKEVPNNEGVTGLFTTELPFPKIYKGFIKEVADKRRMYVEIPRAKINYSFDLHYFGRLLLVLLDLPEVAGVLDWLDKKSLGLIAERTDLDNDTLRLPRYTCTQDLANDLQRLQRLYFNRPGVAELSAYTGTKTLRIPVSGSIPFSERTRKIISHPLFLRLHNAVQLGLTYYVFPGACHTRFEHSLGVFANVARYINSLLADDYQPYFRQVIDEQKIATTLIAGLLHDLGQSSFAHSLEDLGLLPQHEALAHKFVSGNGLNDYVYEHMWKDGPLADTIETEWPEVDPARLRWMIDFDGAPVMPHDVGWDIMRAIISGPLDADKTDYLLRDAHHAGVEYARSIDINRFMNSLSASVVWDGENTKGVLAVTWKGTEAGEMITLARTQMFGVIYWHHAVRAAHAMVAHACSAHDVALGGDADAVRDFQRTMFCSSIGELLSKLEASPSPRARELAQMLKRRRLYKRGLSLDYSDDERLYVELVNKKRAREKAGDPLLLGLSEKLSEAINKELAGKSHGRTTPGDVILDIPVGDKDKLGEIFTIDRGKDVARPYTNRRITGNNEEWQNRARSVRVFLSPSVAEGDRALIGRAGFKLLEKL